MRDRERRSIIEPMELSPDKKKEFIEYIDSRLNYILESDGVEKIAGAATTAGKVAEGAESLLFRLMKGTGKAVVRPLARVGANARNTMQQLARGTAGYTAKVLGAGEHTRLGRAGNRILDRMRERSKEINAPFEAGGRWDTGSKVVNRLADFTGDYAPLAASAYATFGMDNDNPWRAPMQYAAVLSPLNKATMLYDAVAGAEPYKWQLADLGLTTAQNLASGGGDGSLELAQKRLPNFTKAVMKRFGPQLAKLLGTASVSGFQNILDTMGGQWWIPNAIPNALVPWLRRQGQEGIIKALKKEIPKYYSKEIEDAAKEGVRVGLYGVGMGRDNDTGAPTATTTDPNATAYNDTYNDRGYRNEIRNSSLPDYNYRNFV